MKILAIETSCDETAVSLVQERGAGVEVLSNIVSSQIEIHKQYGGVVPEVAAREHVLHILPVLDKAIQDSGLNSGDIDAIAVTPGPGLMSSLQSGVETAKSLAFVWDKPIVAVNHVEGHVYANYIGLKNEIKMPAIVLTVSGGHTMLILMRDHGDFELLGETRDDAAGEAFDKAAKLMGLAYPGGPMISARAENFRNSNCQLRIDSLPRPMIDSADFDFSFSGLKTAIRYTLEKDKDWKSRVDEYCFEFEEAIVETLTSKTIKASKKYKARTVMLAGGVAANQRLREFMAKEIDKKLEAVNFLKPDLAYTTDNAAMIGSAGVFKAKLGKFLSWRDLVADCNFRFIE